MPNGTPLAQPPPDFHPDRQRSGCCPRCGNVPGQAAGKDPPGASSAADPPRPEPPAGSPSKDPPGPEPPDAEAEPSDAQPPSAYPRDWTLPF